MKALKYAAEHLTAARRAHLDFDRLYTVRDGRVEDDQLALLHEATYHATMAAAAISAATLLGEHFVEHDEDDLRDLAEVWR